MPVPENVGTVKLRGLRREDLPWLRRWINDPTVAEPFLFVGPVNEVDHAHWFEKQAADPAVETYLALVDEAPCGVFTLKQINFFQRSAELALYLGPEFHGRGLGRRLLEAGLSIGFHEFRLRKIYLHVSTDNWAALKLYDAAGFKQEGLLEAEVIYAGRTIDLRRMALSDVAWRQARGQGLRVALMQPAFLPWLGFFELMASVDRFVLLDDFQVSRQSHAQRNRLFLSPGRPGFVTLPIRHGGNIAATFHDVAIAVDARWWRKLRHTLEQSYARAPFFLEGMALLEPILAKAVGSLADINIALIHAMALRLGIKTDIRQSSATPTPNMRRSERVLELLKLNEANLYYAARGSHDYMAEDGVFPAAEINVLFQEFEPKPYRQIGNREFHPKLSSMDAIFNLSPDQCRRILFGTRKWRRWDEVSKQQQPVSDAQIDDMDVSE